MCEDECLSENNDNYCGRTDHFTNFAILLGAGIGNDGGCGDGNYQYVTGDWFGDLMLVMSICLLLIIICCVIGFIFTVVPPFKRIMYGKEGYRIVSLRQASAVISS